MTKKTTKLLLCSLTAILLLTGCSFNNKKKDTDKGETKQPSKVLKEDKVGELKISGLTITYKDKMSTVVATVTNESNAAIELSSLSITLRDKDDKVIVETIGNIGNLIQPKESKQFTSIITMDVRNATKVTYDIIK